MSDFAPGIPRKDRKLKIPTTKTPEVWEFGLHRHHSEGAAGEHLDLRLGDHDGHAHSWAMKDWPRPGEKQLVIHQPTHTREYMDFEGRIEGYGKGNVELARRDKTEILYSDPTHIRFNVYGGREVEDYYLKRLEGDDWLLHNVTSTNKSNSSQNLPSSKPAYRSQEPGKLKLDNPDTVLQAKIDGAHVLYQFRYPGSQVKVFSYRPSERSTGIIEHTHKLPDFHTLRTPSGMSNTILRGELYAADQEGKALPSERVGGILNSGVWKSRAKQEVEGKLLPVVFDVVRWNNKDVSQAPFGEKLKMLQEATQKLPALTIPRTAHTTEEKQKLLDDVTHHREPSTTEGVIEWDRNKPVPTKAKLRDQHDVYIREVFHEAGERKGLAGGFTYSMSPRGAIVGKVGTGFSHGFKRDLEQNPDRYIGLKAKLEMARGHLGRAPSFKGLHLDQDIPEEAKLAHELLKQTYPAK